MKILKPLIILSVVLFSVSAFKPIPFKGKLEKAFEALSIYNYFEAREFFYKSLKKHESAASYGLAVIYERNDNPFHSLDSAHRYISLADSLYPLLSSEKLSKYAQLDASIEQVDSLYTRIDSLFFVKAAEVNSIEGWKNFISNHRSEPYNNLALQELHDLAFQNARSKDNSEAYRSFIENYSGAVQVEEAKKKLDEALYREETKSGLIVDYQRFIRGYPQSPYRSEAERFVYEKFTQDEKLSSYMHFIQENPQSSYVSEAWKRIYAIEIKELSPESIAAFTLKHPNYPYLDELQREYDLVTTRFYPVFNGEKWGFIDEAGNLKIQYRFDFVEPFRESLALVGVGDSIAFINKTGRFINDELFEDGFSFKRGFAVVMTGGNYGAINRLGEWVVYPEYEDVGEFSGGMFYLLKDDLYGYADQNGDLVIDFQYSDANDFMNNRAVVALEGNYGIIDINGERLSAFKYDWIDGFKESGNPLRFRLEQQFGLLSPDGTQVDSALYDQIGEFSESKALFAVEGKYGFLNTYGDTVILPKYTYSATAFSESAFHNGYAKVFQEDKVAIIDSLGNKVFPAIFQDIGKYQGSLIPIKKRGKWGYADLKVDLVIPYQFEMAENFKDSVAIVKKDGKYFLIDSLGKALFDSTYNELRYLGEYLISADSLFGIIDRNGQILVPMTYQSIEKIDNKVAKLKRSTGKIDYFNYMTNRFIWRQD